MLRFKKLLVLLALLLVAWLSFSIWPTIPSAKASSFNLYVKHSTQTLGGQTCYLMSDVPPSQNGYETVITKSITNAGDEITFCRSILSLSGIASIDSATWTIKFRHKTSVTIKSHQLKVHFYILKSDGSVRQDLGTVTLGTWSNHNTWVTRTYNYNFGGYTVVNQTDYFAVDWIHKSIDGAGYVIYFMLDSQNVADSDNSQIANFNYYSSNAVPTIGEFQAPSTVYANKYFLLNATVNDQGGADKLLNATVQLSNSVILEWVALTNSFSVYYDPNGYCTLDADGSFKTVVNATALKLTWKIKLGWAYPEGFVSVIAANTTVFDNNGASGSGSYANLFVFEDDLIIYSASCSETDNRTGCGQPITFNGTLYYEGTEMPPEDVSGITVKVDANSQMRGSTTSIASDGTFSITVQSESTVGFYIYTVYATTDEATMQNQTFGIIVDKLSITIIPSKLKANLNEEVAISWTIKRAYDDSVCSDFIINLARDGQLWGENLTNSTVADVSSLTTQHVYSVLSALDNTYGLTAYDALSATVSWGSLIPSSPPTIHIDIQPINLGEVQATATVNFTITATFDMQRITITKIEFQAESTWFKVLTTLPKTCDKGLNAWGTATIDAQLTLPATAKGTYTIPFIIHTTLPDGTRTQANSYITITAKTSTLNFTTETFIETITRLLGNPIILILLIALITWLSAYSLKKH